MTGDPSPGAESGPGAQGTRLRFHSAWPFVLLGLGLLGLGLSFWRPIPAGVWHDDGVYLVIGEALAGGDGLRYSGVPGAPPAVKFPPLYPGVLALLWLAFGSLRAVTLAAVFLNLALLAAAGVLLSVALHRSSALPGRTAVLAGGLAFVSADVWRPAIVPLSEPLFIALLAACLATWSAVSRPGDRKGLALLAGLLTLAVLTRTAGIAAVVGFAVALVPRRGAGAALAATAPPTVVALGWARWAEVRAADIPEGMRDVLGPYGGWLADQVLGASGSFLAALPEHAVAVLARVFALLLPGLTGTWLLAASVPLTAVMLFGMLRLGRALPPLPWVALAYAVMLLCWPFADRRLVAPLHPLLAVAVAAGFLAAWEASGRRLARRAVGVGAFAWVALLTTVTAGRSADGWAVAGYQLRAGRLAAAVEALERTAPPGAVVGAPEFWAGLHLHGGWATVPSARFTPRSEDEAEPVWGTPREQLDTWWRAGVDHVLLEQGGQIHGDALNLLEERCPGSVTILARMRPQILVRLSWDAACARSLELDAVASRAGSPLDGALLGRVHLLGLAVRQEHGLDLLVEESP